MIKLYYILKQPQLKKIYLLENEIAYLNGIRKFIYKKILERELWKKKYKF